MTSSNTAKAEALEQGLTFEHDGEQYVIERANVDNLEAFEALEDENYITAVRAFLGRKQWATFKDSHRGDDGRVPMKALDVLLTKILEVVGNLNASSGS